MMNRMMQMGSRIMMAIAAGLAAATVYAADSDDWAAYLGARGAEEARQSEVVGMTSDELDSYAKEQMEEAAGDDEIPEAFIRNRRRVVVREMQFGADWDCDPTGCSAMVGQFKRFTGLEAQALVPAKPITFDSPELFHYPIVYMTAHYAFRFTDEEVRGMRKYVERGGFVFVDDCLYGQTFGPAFVGEMQRIFADGQWKEIDPKDPVNGLVLKQKFSFNAGEAGIPRPFMNQNPWQGVFLGGILGVLYTVQDLGCGWEISSPPTPSNPLGAGMHSKDMNPGERLASYQMAVNVILFSMLH